MNTMIRIVPTFLATLPLAALAHVPFIEEADYTEAAPYVVLDVENSKAIAAQLRTPGDVDFFHIAITEPARLLVSSNIPFCPQYADFSVSLALIGPGLPAPGSAIPVALKPGEGAIVIRDEILDPAKRTVFFDRISGRQSWVGPKYVLPQAPAGVYTLAVWNDKDRTGDYIAVIGEAERFGPAEIRQTQQVSPRLANGRNLMVDCNPTRAAPAQTTSPPPE